MSKETTATVLARIDERQKSMDDKLEQIHTQVQLTNGRVTTLENWKSKLAGAQIAITTFALIFGAIIGWVINFLTQ